MRRFLIVLLALIPSALPAQTDPLPSWNDGGPKRAILKFVAGAKAVPEPERIAVFDNDGTLWAEQPVYFQLAFALDRIKALAPKHPDWATTEPYKSVLAGDMKGVMASGEKGLGEIMAVAHSGIFTTDNGPNQFTWPDAATTPFRSEKDTNWEGAFRVPAFIRWPGKIKAGEISNDIVSGLDWFPTLLAAAGDTGVKERLLKGWKPGGSDTTFRNHLDGFNQLDYLTGKSAKSARTEFAYFSDDGDLVAYRYQHWKAVFAEQKKPGGFPVWYEPFTSYRVPKLFHLRMDPYERADVVSDQYDQWRVENAYLMGEMTWHAAAFLETFKDYPPSQRPASFSIDQIRKDVDKVIDKSFKDRAIEK